MKKPTILIIEDEEDQIRLYKSALKKYSDYCIIKSTSNLEEAKKTLLEDEVCLISLDLSLGEVDSELANSQQRTEGVDVSGMSFLKGLRSTNKGKLINVIVVSGEEQVSNVTKSLQNFGALAYYEKPVDLDVYSCAVYSTILHNSVLELLDDFENSMDWNTLTLIQKKWQEAKKMAQDALINVNNFRGDLDVKIITMQNNFNKAAKLPSNNLVEQALRDMVIGEPTWTVVQVYIKNMESFEGAQADQVDPLLHYTGDCLRDFRDKFDPKGSFIGLYKFTGNYAFVLISRRFITEYKDIDWLIDKLSMRASNFTNKPILELQGLSLDSLILPKWEAKVWTSHSDIDNFPDLHECLSIMRKTMG